MDIIKRNFINIICSGALNQYVSLEPMSVFKWKRLVFLFCQQRLAAVALKGIKHYQFDKKVIIPPVAIAMLDEAQTTEHQQSEDVARMANPTLNRRLKKIVYNEQHGIDTSMETLQLLNIILLNVNKTLNTGISMRGIIDLGHYLRTKGDKVDFVKLETWLNQLSMQRMAQLQGSILIAMFKFEQSELPFVNEVEKNAYQLAMLSLSRLQDDTVAEWHFKQSKSGFVKNNNAVMRKNLRRSIRYINYAPIETMSAFVMNFAKGLSEIEE